MNVLSRLRPSQAQAVRLALYKLVQMSHGPGELGAERAEGASQLHDERRLISKPGLSD